MGHFRKNVISIFMNDYCNMRCIYCPVHSDGAVYGVHRTSQVIDLRFARCGVRDYFRQQPNGGVRFFSNGEPTLSFDHMKTIHGYSKEVAGASVFVELQTNGLFSEDVAHWVSERVDMLWVSLDGLEDVQEIHRPTRSGRPSFPIIDRNIRIAVNGGRTKVGLRPTIGKANVDKMRDLVDYALQTGAVAVYPYPWVSYLRRVAGQSSLREFADSFLEVRAYAHSVAIHFETIFTVNFDEQIEVNCRALLPVPHLTPDGYVSCCDMMNSGNGLLPDLLYGRYDPSAEKIHYFEDKIAKIRSRNVSNLAACSGCDVLPYCAGGCIGAGMISTGSFYGTNSEYCEITKYLFAAMKEQVGCGFDDRVPLHP